MFLELMPAITASAGAAIIAVALSKLMRPVFLEQQGLREKKLGKVKDQIKKKIEGGINLEAKEVADIGRGIGLNSGRAIEALYQLYSEAQEQESHNKYKKLIEDINRTEPFESLPEEARPSLARLAEISQSSGQESDKELLHPITKILAEYQDMNRDHAAMKKQNWVSYIVALISFFIGTVGLILAFTGPSKDFIQEEIHKSTESIQLQIKNAQPVVPKSSAAEQ
ncbi:hypothetical protein [Pseudoalteromonas sp. PPB1]|uniref:hypothetical protein n=1 Tax=Pseudoalteromonas sp. PPB1 TaxID=2756136 RepID=UPI0018914F09|nr:hypothetical protein [Pseudoalteromonas sp. PPB1]